MSERFKEHDWKSCDAGMYPEVQILFSAPKKEHPRGCSFLAFEERACRNPEFSKVHARSVHSRARSFCERFLATTLWCVYAPISSSLHQRKNALLQGIFSHASAFVTATSSIAFSLVRLNCIFPSSLQRFKSRSSTCSFVSPFAVSSEYRTGLSTIYFKSLFRK